VNVTRILPTETGELKTETAYSTDGGAMKNAANGWVRRWKWTLAGDGKGLTTVSTRPMGLNHLLNW
jgi:hypothetical protein